VGGDRGGVGDGGSEGVRVAIGSGHDRRTKMGTKPGSACVVQTKREVTRPDAENGDSPSEREDARYSPHFRGYVARC